MKNNCYVIENFDVYNLSLLEGIIDFFNKKFPNMKIKTFDEMTGWFEETTIKKVHNLLKIKVKKYIGLDRIILEIDDGGKIEIIFHEQTCVFTIDKKLKTEIESKLKFKLKVC